MTILCEFCGKELELLHDYVASDDNTYRIGCDCDTWGNRQKHREDLEEEHSTGFDEGRDQYCSECDRNPENETEDKREKIFADAKIAGREEGIKRGLERNKEDMILAIAKAKEDGNQEGYVKGRDHGIQEGIREGSTLCVNCRGHACIQDICPHGLKEPQPADVEPF
jgi:hypothetical protein